MKRRGFLGLLGGAVAAGPSMAKQAASATLADLSLPGGIATTLGSQYGGEVGIAAAGPDHYRDRFDAFTRLLGSAEHLARRKANWHVHQLDPDLAGYRSMSLSAKIAIQKEREFNRWLTYERSWLERMIRGEESNDYY